MGAPPVAGSRNLQLSSGSSQCILLWSGFWIQANANLRTEIPSPCGRMRETRSSASSRYSASKQTTALGFLGGKDAISINAYELMIDANRIRHNLRRNEPKYTVRRVDGTSDRPSRRPRRGRFRSRLVPVIESRGEPRRGVPSSGTACRGCLVDRLVWDRFVA